MVAYFPADDLRLVTLTNRGFVWLTELMPALVGQQTPRRGEASGAARAGRFEEGLFQYTIVPEGNDLQVEIDLIGRMRFVPAGAKDLIAEKFPAAFRLRSPEQGPRHAFEFDWGEVRSYLRSVADCAGSLLPLARATGCGPRLGFAQVTSLS
jgi:hypothetical protein